MNKLFKVSFLFILLINSFFAFSQPVTMDEAKIEPLTDNIILHDLPGIPPAQKVESVSVQILSDNKIVVSWEDDLSDIGAGWVMFDSEGNLITKGIRSFQKQDGSYPALSGMYAPKIKANPFGSGFLFGATYYDWSGADTPQNIIPKLVDQFNDEDAPVIQLVRNDGEFENSFMTGLPLDFIARPGALRLADVGYLSNGNLIAVIQNYQESDGKELFDLPNSKMQTIASIFNQEGRIINGPLSIQKIDEGGKIWHGLAVGKEAFGIRYHVKKSAKIRFFNNNFEPISEIIELKEIGIPAWDRGESIGWHSDGHDRYLLVNQNGCSIHVDVLNSSGKKYFDSIIIPGDNCCYGDRCDGAIDQNGNVIAVYEYIPADMKEDYLHLTQTAITAQAFDSTGEPVTPEFQVSSIPYDDCVARDTQPRIAMRNGVIAVVWMDKNTNLSDHWQISLRLFKSPF